MWALTTLRVFEKPIFVSAMIVLFLAGCAAPTPTPSAPAGPVEKAAAPVESEAETLSQISWNPATCNFPVGSGVEPLEITHIEVTQGVQTPDNELSLIAGRSTAVLAHISTVVSATHTLTGTMTVTDASGQTVAVLDPSAQMLAEGSSSDRSYAVLVFEPFAISDSQPVTVSVEVRADIGADHVATAASVEEIPVLVTVQPSFYYSLIHFLPREYWLMMERAAQGYPSFMELTESPYGDALMRGVMPADDETEWFYEHFQDIDWGQDNHNYQDSIAHKDSCGLFKVLADMRETIVTPFVRPTEDNPISVGSIETKFLHGWVYAPTCTEEHSNVVQENGNTTMGGRVAYGSTTPCNGQHTYVHETLHNLYVGHDSTLIDVCGWDVGSHLEPGWWSPSASVEQRKPLQFSRIMDHNSSTNVSWAASGEYKEAMAYFYSTTLHDFMQMLPDCSTGKTPCVEQGQYVFQGCLDSNQSFPKEIFTTYQNHWYSQPTESYIISDPKELPYRLVFRSGGDDITEVPFDARMATNPDDDSEGISDLGFFSIAVPEAIVLSADEIVIQGKGIDEIPFRSRTEPPEITSLDIYEGDGEGRLTVSVTAKDVDTAKLACQFSFSPDNGGNWFPLEPTTGLDAVPLDLFWISPTVQCENGGASWIELQEMSLPKGFPSVGRILRVAVSDGFNIITEDVSY